MTSLAESYAHTTAVLGGDLWGDPTEAETEALELDQQRPICPACGDAETCTECTGEHHTRTVFTHLWSVAA